MNKSNFKCDCLVQDYSNTNIITHSFFNHKQIIESHQVITFFGTSNIYFQPFSAHFSFSKFATGYQVYLYNICKLQTNILKKVRSSRYLFLGSNIIQLSSRSKSHIKVGIVAVTNLNKIHWAKCGIWSPFCKSCRMTQTWKRDHIETLLLSEVHTT